jgi:hypothetical protein
MPHVTKTHARHYLILLLVLLVHQPANHLRQEIDECVRK